MMGSTGNETIKAIQKTLEPYIRPREEVTRIRQVLAAHLDSCFEGASAVAPLALVDVDGPSSSRSTARGLQREYLEALAANIRARSEFTVCCREQKALSSETSTATDDNGGKCVEGHLAAIRLQKKHERLEAVEKTLNLLKQKPAASPGFLDPDEVFRDLRSLPDVPKELATALAFDKTSPDPRLKDLIDKLEIHVLQANMLLRREEQFLEKVKSRFTARPESIDETTKFEALNRTRAELINWMEAELSKASGDDANSEGQDIQTHRAPGDPIHLEEQFASIREKYTQYLEARKALLQFAGQQAKPDIKPPTKDKQRSAVPAPKPRPVSHLLSPYLEQLLSVAREQKGLITEKAYINAAIAKQTKENSKVIDHLAEESQLIPAHPMPGSSRRSSPLMDGLEVAECADPYSAVRPWVFAADSAKISTLETVAENIEEGQIALEGSMHTLAKLDQLLGRRTNSQKDSDDGVGTTGDDIWLAEDKPSEKRPGTRKHTSRNPETSDQPWSVLKGNLGLLRADKQPP
jgi:hypothetical protein